MQRSSAPTQSHATKTTTLKLPLPLLEMRARCVAQRRACARARSLLLQSVAVCCSVLQCVAIRCSVLQCVFQFSTPSRHIYMRKGKVVSVVVCCSVLQCVAHPYHHVRVHKHEAFMLQCVAVCSMIHRSRDI